MSRRGRSGAIGAAVLVVVLAAGWMAWSASDGPGGTSAPTVTRARGATRPAGPTVTDLASLEELQARFNADKDTPRLVLALAPT